MRVLTPKQEEVYKKLLRLANGNSLVVEEALRECTRTSPEPDLADVVKKIREIMAERRSAHYGRRKDLALA